VTETQHGGKRPNAGRKKGTTHASNATKLQFRELVRTHSKEALNALVSAANDPENTQRVQAATVLIQYSYGKPGSMTIQEPDIADIMNKLKSGEISARDAAFEIEASGSPLPEIVKMTLTKELGLEQNGDCRTPDYAKLELLYAYAIEKSDEDQAALLGRGKQIEREVNELKHKAKS
jgi:hypothetical protein